MATRNVRPRVLTAINDLGTFTIAELCRAAGLTDRNQAYAQLDRLRERGFLEQKTLPASGPYAPLKQYTLVSDQEKRSEFAGELAAYRPSPPVWAESELATLALEEAQRELDGIDRSLLGIEEGKGTRPPIQLFDWRALAHRHSNCDQSPSLGGHLPGAVFLPHLIGGVQPGS